MQKRNWKSKVLVLIMAFVMVFTCTNTSFIAFANDEQATPVVTDDVLVDDNSGDDVVVDENEEPPAPIEEDLVRAAEEPQGGLIDDKDHNIEKMQPKVEMQYYINNAWRDQKWVEDYYKNGQHGGGVPSGTKIKFKVSFTPDKYHDYLPTDELFYVPLSSLLHISTMTGTMEDGMDTCGAWTIKEQADHNYLLVIDLDDNYINNVTNNLEGGNVWISGEIRYTEGEANTMPIPFPGTDPIVVPIKKKNVTPVSLSVVKGKLNSSNGHLNNDTANYGIYKENGEWWAKYYIEVKNDGDTKAENVIVKDFPGTYQSSVSGQNYNPKQHPAGDQIFATGNDVYQKISGSGDLVKNSDGVWVWNVGEVAGHSTVTLEYKFKLTDAVTQKDVELYNEAGVYNGDTYYHHDWEKTTTVNGLDNPTKDTKKYNGYSYHRRADGKGVITYNVSIQAKTSNKFPLSNVKVHDYFESSSQANKLQYDDLKVKVAGKAYTVGAPQTDSTTGLRTWKLTSDTGVDQGNIVERKDSSGRRYVEFYIKTLNAGEKIEFSYDAIIDDSLFNAAGSSSKDDNTGEITNQTGVTIKNKVYGEANNHKTSEIEKSVTTYKGWLKKNGKKLGSGFWEFTLKINEPKPQQPALAKDTTVNNIGDKLGKGYIYCDSEKNGDGSKAYLTVTKYPISADGNSYDRNAGVTETKEIDTSRLTGDAKYDYTWAFQDTGAYYYEVKYYAKRVDSSYSDDMGNGAGYGIGPDLKPFEHEADWNGEDDTSEFIKKNASGFNEDNTKAFWEVKVQHNLYQGYKLKDSPDTGSLKYTIDKESMEIGIQTGQTITPLAQDKYSITYNNDDQAFEITFLQNVQASENAPLVIKYATDLDAAGIESVPAGEKATYKNKVKIVDSLGNEVDATAEQSFTKADYISKRCAAINGDIITWEYTINGTGHMSGTATVKDVIPEGNEYIDGTAHITACGSNAGETVMQIAQPAIQDGKLVMLFDKLQGTQDNTGFVTVQLQTKITDPNFYKENVNRGDITYTNEVRLEYKGMQPNAIATAQPENTVLTKNSDAMVGNECSYTISINEKSIDMNPDADFVKLIDEHSSNMMIMADEKHKILLEKYNAASGTWEAVDPQPKAEIKDNVLTMMVPDNQKMRLTYTCYVFGAVGERVQFSNKVKFEGSKTEIEKKKDEVIQNGGGELDGVPTVTVKKVDGSDAEKTLKGIKFAIYEVTAEDGKLVLTEKDTKITNDNGIARFRELDKNTVYAVKEIETLQDYILSDEIKYFYFNASAVTGDIAAAAKAEGVEINKVVKGFSFLTPNTPRSLEISKVDFATGRPLKGAIIQVKNPNGSVFEEFETDGNNHVVRHLMADTVYTVTEIKAPDGYEKFADFTFELDKEGNLKNKDKIDSELVSCDEDASKIVIKDIPQTKVNVEKIWNDKDLKDLENKGYSRPDTITYRLYGTVTVDGDEQQVYPKDEPYKTAQGKKANNWAASFDKLPKFDEATGQEIKYYVYEEDLEAYTSDHYERNPAEAAAGKVTITNTPEEGEDFIPLTMNIHKVDTSTKKNLEGAKFTIKLDGEVVGEAGPTDEYGMTSFKFNKPGEYVVTENQAPDGYIIGTEEYHVEVTKGGVNSVVKRPNSEGVNIFVKIFNLIFGDNELLPFANNTLTVDNTPRTFQISKVDFENTSEELPGAHIQVLDANGDVFDEWDTGRVHTVSNLESGVLYTIKETKVPEGFEAINDITFMLNEDGTLNKQEGTVNTEKVTSEATDTKITLKDMPLTKVEAKKIWNDGNIAGKEGYTRPEITFNMIATVDGQQVRDKETKVANEGNNWTVTFENLPKYQKTTGKKITYSVYEDEQSGYKSDNTTAETAVDATANNYKVEITNTPDENEDYLPIDLHVLKTDSTDKEKKLENAKFKVTDENGAVVEEVKATDKDGKTTFTFTKPGTYTVEEVEAPDGYLLGKDKYVVTVEPNGIVRVEKRGNIFTKIYDLIFGKNDLKNFEDGVLTVPNEPTDVEVLKVDENDPTKILNGAHMEILDENMDLVEEWDSTGEAHHVKNLEIGKTYYLKETIAPEGYALVEMVKFVVDENNKVKVIEDDDPEKTNPTPATVNSKGQLLLLDPIVSENAKITVTKRLYAGNEGALDVMGARDRTFYVALFSDKNVSDRVSSIKPIEFKNQSVNTVTFENIADNRDYYIAEVDENGKVLNEFQPIEWDEEGNVKNGYIMDFDGGEKQAKVHTEGEETVVEFKNVFWKIPEHDFHAGELEITKKVVDTKGNPIEVTGSFYVSAFKDAELTQWAYTSTEIKLSEQSEGKGYIRDMGIGTYYLAETDANGIPVDDTYDYVPHFTTQQVTVVDDEEAQNRFYTTLTNKEPVDSFDLIKLVKNSKGKAKKVTETFYVTVYSDAECTQIVKIVEIPMEKASKATVTVSGLKPGTYYLAETDEFGVKVDKRKFNYKAKFSRDTINIVRADLTEDVTLTNTEKPPHVKTGDEAPLALGLLLMALSGIGGVFAARRRKSN